MASPFQKMIQSLLDSSARGWSGRGWEKNTRRQVRVGFTKPASPERRRHRKATETAHHAQHRQAARARRHRQRHHAQISAQR